MKRGVNVCRNLLGELAERTGVSVEELLSHSRLPRVVDARSMTAAMLKEKCGVRQQDVADLLGVSQAAVSKMLRRHRDFVRYNADYRRRWGCVESLEFSV